MAKPSYILQGRVLRVSVSGACPGGSHSNSAGADHDFWSGGADSRRWLGGSGRACDGPFRPTPRNELGQRGRRAIALSEVSREVTVAKSRARRCAPTVAPTVATIATGLRIVGDGAMTTVGGVPCDEGVGEWAGEIGTNGDRQRETSTGPPGSRDSTAPAPVLRAAAARCESRRALPE